MQAYGTDRLRLREDGAAVLSCRVAKEGWQARIEKTLTSPEHPGTAIEWDEEFWEVVGFETIPAGVRYTLVRWSDTATAMRFIDHYDEQSEVARATARQQARAREQGRKAATFLGVLTGHLPAAVQEAMASELGIRPVRLTMVSTVLPFLALITLVMLMVGNIMRASGAEAGKPIEIPPLVAVIAVYLGAESLLRFFYAFIVNKPIGSLIGMIGYSIFYGLSKDRSRLVAPLAGPPGDSVRTAPLTDDQKLESELALVEPLFTLLAEHDQQKVAQRYGVDYRRNASTVAVVVMVFSMLGIFTSIGSIRQMHLSGFVSLVVAGLLFADQLWRFPKLQRGPVGSILRFVLRPFLTRYLA